MKMSSSVAYALGRYCCYYSTMYYITELRVTISSLSMHFLVNFYLSLELWRFENFIEIGHLWSLLRCRYPIHTAVSTVKLLFKVLSSLQ